MMILLYSDRLAVAKHLLRSIMSQRNYLRNLYGSCRYMRDFLSPTQSVAGLFAHAGPLSQMADGALSNVVRQMRLAHAQLVQSLLENGRDQHGRSIFDIVELVKTDLRGALDILTSCVVKFSWFTPTESEKARVLIALGEWELASESANRALQLDPNNVEALALSVLVLLAKESKYSAASSRLVARAILI